MVHCALSLRVLYGNINTEVNFQKVAWVVIPMIPVLVNESSARISVFGALETVSLLIGLPNFP